MMLHPSKPLSISAIKTTCTLVVLCNRMLLCSVVVKSTAPYKVHNMGLPIPSDEFCARGFFAKSVLRTFVILQSVYCFNVSVVCSQFKRFFSDAIAAKDNKVYIDTTTFKSAVYL
jgi:hypothetical protein